MSILVHVLVLHSWQSPFFEQSQKKRWCIYVYIYIHISSEKSQEITSAWHLFMLNVPFFPVALPCHCITENKRITCFPECHVAMFKIRSVKTNWRRPLQPKVSCVSGAGSRRGYNILMLVIAHVYSKYWWMPWFFFIYSSMHIAPWPLDPLVMTVQDL